MLRVVHLEHAAAKAFHFEHRRNGDAFIATALTPHVMVVRYVRTARELEDLLGTRSDPVPAVGLGPGEGAALLHVVGDRQKLLPVVGTVPIEVIAALILVDGALVMRGGHRVTPSVAIVLDFLRFVPLVSLGLTHLDAGPLDDSPSIDADDLAGDVTRGV